MTKKGMIFSGGDIDRDFVLAFLRNCKSDAPVYIIAADRGLAFCQDNGIEPDAIVGDFDSADRRRLEVYRDGDTKARFGNRETSKPLIRLFRPEKDWTDTQLAAELACEQGLKDLVLVGGTGTRLDHVLGNIQVMDLMMERGVTMQIVDPHNRITLHREGFAVRRDSQWGRYVSLIAWSGEVTGLTLQGFAYPLEDFTLTTLGSRAISNEIAEETGRILFDSGKLLVIESRDS